MSIKRMIRQWAWKAGYDIVRFTPSLSPLAQRSYLLRQYNIDTVLDVGANSGQYGLQLRQIGYHGRMVSFEPYSSAREKIQILALRHPVWEIFPYALGRENGTSSLHIAGNSESSSLLNMTSAHLETAPESRYIGREPVEVRTLDSLMETVCGASYNIWLKLDTQGSEAAILDGAKTSLHRINTLEIEMSLIPMYHGETLFFDLCPRLFDQGYQVITIEPVLIDKTTKQLLQVDVILHRKPC